MNNKSEMIHALSSAGVAINTCLFGINLFRDDILWAVFALACACLCWTGVFNNPKEENNNGD